MAVPKSLSMKSIGFFGYDDTNNLWQALAIDSNGNLKVALAATPDIDIGDVRIQNPNGDLIYPATETTLLNLLYGSQFAAVMGEVQATPTQFTVLDRLKTLDASILGLYDLISDSVNLKNVAMTIINPATEEKQDSAISYLTSINARDFATETTLALIKAKTDNLDVLLSTLALESGGNLDIISGATKLEDSGHSSGDRGMFILGVRNEGHDDFSGTDKDYIPIGVDATGDVYVYIRHMAALVAGTAEIGNVKNSGTFLVQPTYTPSTPYKLVSAASTNATSLKGSAGVIYGIQISNINASPRYLKLYNKASAPTVGTDTPVKTLIIPGNATGAGSNVPISIRGINFSTGIAFALTVEATDAGTTGVAANEIVVNIDYI